MLLVTGGESDPNILHLLDRLRQRRIRHHPFLVGAASHPSFVWDLNKGTLSLGRRRLRPTGAFIRYDVFGQMSDPRPAVSFRAAGWFSSVQSWLDSQPDVRIFNRRARYPILKPGVLLLARELGIETPRSFITNCPGRFRSNGAGLVVKPVNGGDYCRELHEVLRSTEIRAGVAATPAIIQEKLAPPDVRVYVIGKTTFAFTIQSRALDYREDPEPTVQYLGAFERRLGMKLIRLNRALGLDFSATDFKTCQRTGRLKFLEINTGPMFVAFDKAANGELADGMIHALSG